MTYRERERDWGSGRLRAEEPWGRGREGKGGIGRDREGLGKGERGRVVVGRGEDVCLSFLGAK